MSNLQPVIDWRLLDAEYATLCDTLINPYAGRPIPFAVIRAIGLSVCINMAQRYGETVGWTRRAAFERGMARAGAGYVIEAEARNATS